MKTFYFNTGVRPFIHNPPVKLSAGQIMKGGTMQIPFDCEDVPEGAIFKFACENKDLRESKYPNYIVREIHNSTLIAKYAYFQIFN